MAGIDTSLVECIVVVVPEMASFATVAGALAQLVDESAIRILDLVVATRRRQDHEVILLELDAIEEFPVRNLLGGPVGDLLSENDIALAAAALLPGSVGLLMVVEDRWAGPLSLAAQQGGGRLVAGERIPRARIEAALAEIPAELTDPYSLPSEHNGRATP